MSRTPSLLESQASSVLWATFSMQARFNDFLLPPLLSLPKRRGAVLPFRGMGSVLTASAEVGTLIP